MILQPERIRRVLLIRRKALGDCLVTLPAVRQLAAALPAARLDLVVDRPFTGLMERLVPEARILSWSRNQGEWAWYRDLRGQGYDLVIDWLGSPRTALWTAISGAPWRVGYDLPRRRWAYNLKVPRNRLGDRPTRGFAGEAFLDPLRTLGMPVQPWRPLGLKPAFREGDLGEAYGRWRDGWLREDRLTVAMMMSATWPAKAWPARHVGQLWRLIENSGRRALFIPGPGDTELVRELQDSIPAGSIAPQTSLLELADLLGRCVAFVGTDCGPRHLATVLGLPTATVFGPTDAVGWNPADPRHVSLSSPVDCLGCDHKLCPLPGRPCLEDLPAAVVLAGLEGILAAPGKDDP